MKKTAKSKIRILQAQKSIEAAFAVSMDSIQLLSKDEWMQAVLNHLESVNQREIDRINSL